MCAVPDSTIQEKTFEEVIDLYRQEILLISMSVLNLNSSNELNEKETTINGDNSDEFLKRKEMKANIELAYRHLEDARMRLGKVLQAKGGGVSIYNNKEEFGIA